MSLKIWLPLLGNLDNKGSANIPATSSGTSVNTSGKIGSCYSFNGSSSYIKFDSSLFSNSSEEFSYACWVKPNSTNCGCLFSCRTAVNNTGLAIFINSSGNILFDAGNERITKSHSLATGTWYHLAFVYKKGEKKSIYVNGVEIYTVASTGTATTISTANMFIGASQNTNATVNANYLNGYLNDVRIYNHALSTAEIHELAQGLILHYKLNGEGNVLIPKEYQQLEYLESTGTQRIDTGIIPKGTYKIKFKYSFTSISGYVGPFGAYQSETVNAYRILAQNGSKTSLYANFNSKAGSAISVNNVSTDVNQIIDGFISQKEICMHNLSTGNIVRQTSGTDLFPTKGTALTDTMLLFGYGASSYTNCRIYHFSMFDNDVAVMELIPAKRISDNVLGMYDIVSKQFFVNANTGTFTAGPIVESGASIHDSSGYGHHGTVNGTMTLSTDTPKYSYCADFNGTNTSISVPNLTPAELTVSFWMKRNANTGTRQFMYTAWNGITCELQTNGTPTFAVNRSSYPTITGTAITTSSGWVHYCATFDTTNGSKLYQNGVLKASNNNVTPIVYNITTNYIGYYSTCYNGKMSDFRIYATALSADDVYELYNVEAKVDKGSEIYSRSFDEKGSRELIAGALWTNGYSVHTNTPCTTIVNGELLLTGKQSIGSPYIPISPTGHTYVYDIEISTESGNYFYIGFERYDKDKTSRSNNACVYLSSMNGGTAARTHQRYRGTVDLSTDGTNPCAYIALRILNDWSSPNNRKSTIHKLSLREVSTVQTPRINNSGVFEVDELNENMKAAFYKNGFVEATEFIEM